MPAQTKRKRRHFYKINSRNLLFGFFVIAAFVLTFGGVIRIVGAWNDRVWRGEHRVTFVIATNPPLLASYQAEPGELIIIQFPSRLEINSSFGLGRWKLESLYELGRQRGVGGEILAKTVQYALGIPVDGWMSEEGMSLVAPSFQALFSYRLDTNFTFFDKVRIAWEISTLKAGKRRLLSAEKLGMVKGARAADGSLGFVLEKQRVKDIVLREFQDTIIVGDGTGVGIVNGTNIAGAGEQIASVLEGLGARVIWVRTQSYDIPRCKILAKEERPSRTAKRLAALFSCSLEEQSNIVAPIELVIGEELARETAATR